MLQDNESKKSKKSGLELLLDAVSSKKTGLLDTPDSDEEEEEEQAYTADSDEEEEEASAKKPPPTSASDSEESSDDEPLAKRRERHLKLWERKRKEAEESDSEESSDDDDGDEEEEEEEEQVPMKGDFSDYMEFVKARRAYVKKRLSNIKGDITKAGIDMIKPTKTASKSRAKRAKKGPRTGRESSASKRASKRGPSLKTVHKATSKYHNKYTKPHFNAGRSGNKTVQWQGKYKEILLFKEKYGHCFPSKVQDYNKSPEMVKLNAWVISQRFYIRNKALIPEKVELLTKIGIMDEWVHKISNGAYLKERI